MLKVIYFILLIVCVLGLIGYYYNFKKYCKEHDVNVSILEKEKKK